MKKNADLKSKVTRINLKSIVIPIKINSGRAIENFVMVISAQAALY